MSPKYKLATDGHGYARMKTDLSYGFCFIRVPFVFIRGSILREEKR